MKTHQDHYDHLQRKADQLADLGIHARISVSAYWSNGVQQVDYYSISTGTSSRGPCSYDFARGFLRGLEERVISK